MLSLSKKPLFGATLMVSGCCIGAGMLGFPNISLNSGFFPSLCMLVSAWIFMSMTGLLLLEVNLTFKEEVNLSTMTEKILGKPAMWITQVLYLFLFYTLMLSYFSGMQEIFLHIAQKIVITIQSEGFVNILIALLFGIALTLGTACVDKVNKYLMAGLVLTYLLLIFLGLPHISLDFLDQIDFTTSSLMLPTMVIAFGFHNLVPTLKTYLQGDVKSLRIAIILGSFIPLIVYAVWELLILGLIPKDQTLFLQEVASGKLAITALKIATGNSLVVQIIELFAFFTILTSLITIALSFVDFLRDGIPVKLPRAFFVLLTLAPPLLFSFFYSHIFLTALSLAGAFGAVIIYGIIPVQMAFKLRKKASPFYTVLVPGGHMTLFILLVFAITIITIEILHITLGL